MGGGVSAHVHVGDGQLGTVGNGGARAEAPWGRGLRCRAETAKGRRLHGLVGEMDARVAWRRQEERAVEARVRTMMISAGDDQPATECRDRQE